MSQAKIYLSLIALGTANAKEISQFTKIDRGEVYRQLEFLQKKALIEKILRTPTEYKPIALNHAIKLLLQQKNKEHSEIKQKAKALLRKNPDADYIKENATKFSVISEDYIKQYLIDAKERTQKEWLWFTQIERIPVTINTYYEDWKKASDRGIRWRTIAELNNPTNKILDFITEYKKENPNFDIRFTDPSLLVTFEIRDNQELDFFTDVTKGLAGGQVIYTNNPRFIRVFTDYFEIRWKTAKLEPIYDNR